MKKKKSFLKNPAIMIILVLVIIVCGAMLRTKLESIYEEQYAKTQEESDDVEYVGRKLNYADPVAEDNPILKAFKDEHPTAEVISAFEEDVTNDGLDDLVVICHLEGHEDHADMVVAIDSGDSTHYEFTEPVTAPAEKQTITFKNIDSKDEMEFILQGQKNNKVGYAIFRIVEGEAVDLFSEGMEDC